MATAKMKHIVRSWRQAHDLFQRAARVPRHGGPARVSLGYATWLHQRWRDGVDVGEPIYVVRLHQTDVVTYLPHGDIEVATGGWRTVTTKRRIEDYTPADVWVLTEGIPPRHGNTQAQRFTVIVGRAPDRVEYDITETGRAVLPLAIRH